MAAERRLKVVPLPLDEKLRREAEEERREEQGRRRAQWDDIRPMPPEPPRPAA
jgi:hypothetical protein